jgi:hypothetical protein
MLLFISILALINSFPLRANIFVLAVEIKVKVKQSRYTPWRRLGEEEV